MLPPFPPEIFYEIALHLPLTEDVIALSLTSRAVRGALSTPVLFKARLLLQGWDIDAWQDEDDKAQRSMDQKRWIRIDYIHSKTLQLLEDSSTGSLSSPLVDSESSSLTPKLLKNWFKKLKKRPKLRNIRNTLIHLEKAECWSRRLSKVFPILIAHHRVNNILRITETKYCDALRDYFMAVTDIYVDMLTHWEKGNEFPGRSSVDLQERACFGLTAFVMQCNAKTIESIFGDRWTAEGSPDFVAGFFPRLSLDAMALLFPFVSYRHPRAPTDIVGTSMQYSTAFLVQVKIHLGLHFEVARSPLSLLPPSIPPMNPASQYDDPFELGSDDISWPWLRDRLAGTPIARLSSTSGDRWAGYYTSAMELRDPPVFFKLDLVPPPAIHGVAHNVYFLGEGTDSEGSFFLEGSADTHTGAVMARQSYVGGHWWYWNGVVTPFGMVGMWGIDRETYGWWWIWPQEWSERSPASQAAATGTQ